MQRRILAIGDIHGCKDRLDALLARIAAEPRSDTLVFIGDYLDRGPDASGVIDTLLKLRETCPGTVFLKGNHEEMFLNLYCGGRDEALFLDNGGSTTLASYGLTPADARAGRGMPESHFEFIASLPLTYEAEGYLFVHAGIRPGVPLADQSPEDLLWIRYDFIESDDDFGQTVVFGHTPLREPLILHNKIGIDTGAVFGGPLTAIELPSLRIYQS
jgi:serine/threonine protein phosphatase 1